MIVQRIKDTALIPTRGSQYAAGVDLYAAEDAVVPARGRILVSTGLIMKPNGPECYIRIAPRSGLAVKGLDVGAGVVDYDYRGEVKVLLINNTDKDFPVKTHDRVAQAIQEKVQIFSEVEESDYLSSDNTSRGAGGFGSTGK